MRVRSAAIVLIALWCNAPALARPLPQEAARAAAAPAPALTDQQIVAFLENAKVVKTKSIGKGVTGAVRATLSDGTLTHDAQIQKIDEKKRPVHRRQDLGSSISRTAGNSTSPPTASTG